MPSIELQSILDPYLWTNIGLSILCGFIIGFERQIHRKPIDIRTSVLICLGTMAFIYIGEQLAGEKDSTRVLGQVVTGIGFLGAGVIFTREGLVIGLTSASVVWVLAAIGAAIGFGLYADGLVLSIVTVFVLIGLHWVDELTARWAKAKNAPREPGKRS